MIPLAGVSANWYVLYALSTLGAQCIIMHSARIVMGSSILMGKSTQSLRVMHVKQRVALVARDLGILVRHVSNTFLTLTQIHDG